MASSPSNVLHDSGGVGRGPGAKSPSMVQKNPVDTNPPPLSVNSSLANTTLSSIRRPLPTDDSDTDFRPVTNKKSQHKQRKSRDSRAYHTSQGVALGFTPVAAGSVQNVTKENRVMNNGNVNHPIGTSSHSFSISHESTRYAQTRYPFPPFTLRFIAGKITVNQVKECLIDHCKKFHQIDLQILNCRFSHPIVGYNQYDILVYVKDVLSFSFLLDQAHWPSRIESESFSLPSVPSIPPQLCLLIKNVDLHIDFNEFCVELKEKFPAIKNIIRMKNKFENDIRMIKLEFTSPAVRDQLLLDKRIVVNYITYDITEYLAPVNVLICSKCMAIGHFRKQCTQIKETCRTCGEAVDDLKNYNCSKVEKCIHCNQNHKSSSLKCPVIKSFRAELTRKILHSNAQTTPSANTNQGFTFYPSHFPPLPASESSTSSNNLVLNKLDELIGKLSGVKEQLGNLEAKNDKFEQFMISKSQCDEIVKADLMILSSDQVNLKKDVIQHDLLINQHGNLLNKLLLPLIDDICSIISTRNVGTKGRTLDADLKSRLDCYRAQLKKAKEDQHIIN